MWLLHAAMQHAALLARVVMGRNPNVSFTIQLGSFIFFKFKIDTPAASRARELGR
jgi:hypothetical protein